MLRRTLLTAAAVSGVLALPSAAPAAVTSSAVTTPDDRAKITRERNDPAPATTWSIAGTSNGTPGDPIQVRCYTAPTSYWSESTTVGAGGQWSLTTSNGYLPCRLYAVPPGAPAAEPDAATFQRRLVEFLRFERYEAGGIARGAALITAGTNAFLDVYDIADCGLCDMALFDRSTWQTGDYLYYGNQAVYSSQDDKRAYLQVDGRNAYLPYAAGNYPSLAGRVPVQIDRLDAGGLDTSEAALVCTTEVVSPPSSGAECGSFAPAGVTATRTNRFSPDGRTVVITDRWSSTDGRVHELDLDYEQYHDTDDQADFRNRFSWVGPELRAGAVGVLGGTGATTITAVQDVNTPNGSFEDPVGALTMYPSPDVVRSYRGRAREYVTNYRLRVGPGNDQVIVAQYDIGDSIADVEARAAVARDRLEPPALSIATPVGGTTVTTPAVSITGTATDNGGAPVVRVDGTQVAVGPDGGWATTVPVANGARTVTVTATDAQGNAVTRTTAFTVAIPPTPDTTRPTLTLTVPSSATVRSVQRSGLKVRVRCNERCRAVGELTGTVRSYTLRAASGQLVLATRSLGLGTGTRTLTLKPSSKLGRSLRKGRTLTARVTVTDAAGNARTSSKRVRLR